MGGFVVKTTTKAASAAVLLAAAAGGVALWRSGDTTPTVHRADAVTEWAEAPVRRARVTPRAHAPDLGAQPVATAKANEAASVNLRGLVVEEDSRSPIAGARVTVVAKSPEATEPGVAAVTDHAGRFELSVPSGRVLIRADCDGWYQPHYPYGAAEVDMWRRGAAFFERNVADVPSAGAAAVEVRLARTGGVEGQVLHADGSPVADAEVVVHAASAGARSTRGKSDEHGRFRIVGVPPVPKLWLDATAPGLVTASPAQAVVEVARVTTGIEIRMRRPPIVIGRLTSSGGHSLAGAAVQVVVVTDNRTMQWGPNGEWLAWSAAEGTPARPDGTYEVPVWPVHGEFVVRATCPGHQPVRSPPVSYDEGRERYTVDLTLPEGAALGGRVTAKDSGFGIAGAVVLAGPATNPLARVVAPLRAISGADGRFVFDALPPETYLVSASAEGYVEARLTATTPPPADLAFVLAPSLSISGTVRLGGRPLAGAIVSVQPQADEGLELFDPFVNPFPDTAKTGADGAFGVRGLEEGRYCVHVRPSSGAPFRARFSAPVDAGASGVVIDVEPLAAGEAPDPHAWLSNRDLGLSAYQLNMDREYEAAAERWKALLTRALTRNERAAALLEYASPLGNLGRRDEQEAALREAIDLAGSATTRGLEGLSRLAWSRYWAGDARAAADLILTATTSTDVVQAAGARWSSAKFAAKLGDIAAARATLTKLRTEVADSTDSRLRRLLPQIDRSLAELPDR